MFKNDEVCVFHVADCHALDARPNSDGEPLVELVHGTAQQVFDQKFANCLALRDPQQANCILITTLTTQSALRIYPSEDFDSLLRSPDLQIASRALARLAMGVSITLETDVTLAMPLWTAPPQQSKL